MVKKLIFVIAIVMLTYRVFAQGDIYNPSVSYEWPKDPLVKEKLSKWQDLKLGVIIHWGLYSIKGIQESWLLCSEPWVKRDSAIAYDDFKKWYWGQASEFNPVKFDPDKWADICERAGMKYVVFTTKHHDGYNMFDTKQTDFKITNGPFANNPKADVTKYIFEAYRKKGMMIGAYFSKPDWHSEYFWWPHYATPNRNANYNTTNFPWRWQKFKNFTYNQISELMHNYGKVDILWLDGGWVRPPEPGEMEKATLFGTRGRAPYPEYDQSVDMPKIAAMARAAQPGILIVDRTVHGANENYLTPEQKVPKTQMKDPWETCMTLGKGWGFIQNEKMKPSENVIHTLVEVVAKGGNLLLGVGPTANGEFPEMATKPLTEIGQWLKENGEAIYGTRITENYNDGATWFTQSKDGKTKYAIACIPEGSTIPATVQWKGNLPGHKRVKLLSTGQYVNCKEDGDMVIVTLPKELKGQKTAALAFSY